MHTKGEKNEEKKMLSLEQSITGGEKNIVRQIYALEKWCSQEKMN